MQYEEHHPEYRERITPAQRAKMWRDKNREKHKAYMRRYMRERRKEAKLSRDAVWCWDI